MPVRLGLFAAALALVFGAAAAVGAAVDPGEPDASCAPAHGMGHQPLGLSVAQGDTTISPAAFTVPAGRQQSLRFRVLDGDGAPVRSGYELEAERRLHLILVRRDLTGYQHLHPKMAADGTWGVPLTVAEPGAYRVFAAFQRDCEERVLAADLVAPGDFQPRPLPAPATTARARGYEVEFTRPALRAGHEALLHFTVTRDGRPVRNLQPYLGARGHLVALRQGDLAYLHAHPEEHSEVAGEIPFAAEFLSAGSYRLFLQFRAGGKVQTVAFTAKVAP